MDFFCGFEISCDQILKVARQADAENLKGGGGVLINQRLLETSTFHRAANQLLTPWHTLHGTFLWLTKICPYHASWLCFAPRSKVLSHLLVWNPSKAF